MPIGLIIIMAGAHGARSAAYPADVPKASRPPVIAGRPDMTAAAPGRAHRQLTPAVTGVG